MKSTKMITGRRKFDKRSIIMSLAALFLVLLCGIWATTQLAMNTTYNKTFASNNAARAANEKARKDRLDEIQRIRDYNAAARAAREAAAKKKTNSNEPALNLMSGGPHCGGSPAKGAVKGVERGSGNTIYCCTDGAKRIVRGECVTLVLTGPAN